VNFINHGFKVNNKSKLISKYYLKLNHKNLGNNKINLNFVRGFHNSSIDEKENNNNIENNNLLEFFKSNVDSLIPIEKFELKNKIDIIKYLFKNKGIVYIFVNNIN
jgi:hypothetical protein